MDIVTEIRKLLAEVQENSAISLQAIASGYEAWVIRKNGWYGIGILNTYKKEISERFSNVRVWNQLLLIAGDEKNLLLLTSEVENLRYEFATVCAEFVEPGLHGETRDELLKNPEHWWEKWRSLLGNSVQNKMPYSVLGEILIYKHLIDLGKEVRWAAIEKATHDLETSFESYEVKSTIKRYDSLISVNSQYQFVSSEKGLFLCFCRFEESLTGKSIEDVMNQLTVSGNNYSELNIAIEKMGFEKGSSARNKKYKLHEARIYQVDEKFPKITSESFCDGKLPEGIVKIVYDVDLNGLVYKKMNILL